MQRELGEMRRALAPMLSTAALVVAGDASAADSKATTAPTTEPAYEAEAIDRRPVVVDEGPNRLLLATGLATLGFTYAVTAYAGLTTELASERWLVVPFAGPWVALARREGCGDASSARCDVEPTFVGLFVASGLLQLGGAAQIVAAFLKRELREIDRPVVQPSLAIAPGPIPGGAALAARGTF